MKTIQKETKKAFFKLGGCSTTYFHILNKHLGNSNLIEEKAAEPLVGGIMKEGCQCGMLWGASLAVGKESCKKNMDRNKAITSSILATKKVMDSFMQRSDTVNCFDLTNTNLKSRFGTLKLILFKSRGCFNLAGRWSAEALEAAKQGLSENSVEIKEGLTNCATLVLEKMGATEQESLTVAGLAGGMGLSGNGCGALAAAIWLNTLRWSKENPGKSTYSNPAADKTLEAFYIETNGEVLCKELTGKTFKNIEEHSDFIKEGGCKELIEALAGSSQKGR